MNNNIKTHHTPRRFNPALGIICCVLFGLQAAYTPVFAVSEYRYHGGSGDGWDMKQVSPPFYQGGAEEGVLSASSASNALLGNVSFYIKGLGFVGAPPENPYAGIPFSPDNPLKVQILDSRDYRYSNTAYTVTVSLENDPAGGSVLGGTTNAVTTNGVATFTNLFINKTGSGFTIKATAPDLSPSTSDPFNVVALPDPPAAPTSVSASDNTYTDKVRITWTAASGATGYQVWRHTANNSAAAAQIGTSASSPYDDTGATAETTYYYWLKATNIGGASAFSSADTGRRAPAIVAPSAPTGVSASDDAYTNKVRVTWTAASGATGYQVWRHTANNSAAASQIGTSASSPYDDTGATAETTYYYWLKATNSAGASAFSSADTGRRAPVVVAPSAPSDANASEGIYTDKVRVTWSAATGATSYQIWRHTANNSAAAAQVGTSASSPYDDTSSVAGTTYYYWVKAVNTSGSSGFSPTAMGWRIASATAPSTPSGVSASDGAYTDKVRVTWTAATGATGYQIWRHTADNSAAASQLGAIAFTTYDDTSAVAGTTYYYWVKATNSAGASAFSSSSTGRRSAPVAAPSAPSGLSASDSTYTDKVRVTWTAASGATGYQIWRHTINMPSGASQLGTTTATIYDDTSAVAGSMYYYWLKATNSGGTSAFSSSVIGRRAQSETLPSAPTGVSASDGTYTAKIKIGWNAVSGATDYQVWRNTANDSTSASLLATTTATTYEDTIPETAGVKVYYWVTARNNLGSGAFSQSDSGYYGISGTVDLSLRGFLFQPAVLTTNAHPSVIMAMPVNNGPENLADSKVKFDFYLSRNTVFGDADDECIGEYQTNVTINAGSYSAVMVSDTGLNGITLPGTETGTFYVFAKVTLVSALSDPDMNNNTIMRSGAVVVEDTAGASNEADESGAKQPVIGDFDGDRKAELALYQESSGNWNIRLSGSEYALVDITGFGGEGWKPVPGDFDGDGLSDLAIYQESTGNWQIKLSGSAYASFSTTMGGLGYAAVPGDFNGGGHSDLAVYREATGYWLMIYIESDTPALVEFGQDGYVPVTGDYTGDGVTDFALYQESVGGWYVQIGNMVYAISGFGGTGYMPVGGDYDGDGSEDLSLYQASTGNWMIRLSGSGYAIALITGYGGPDYLPVSGDYDGDGKADLVLYNAATSTWLFRLSSAAYAIVPIAF